MINKAKIESFAKVGAGQGAPQKEMHFSGDGFPFIRAGHLEELLKGKSELDLPKVNEETARQHKLKLYKPGTIVFAKSGMSATKGRIYKLQNPCYVVNHLATLELNDAVSPAFIMYALRAYSPVKLINDPSYPSISQGAIEKHKIPLPPLLSDQIRIATLLSKADALIAQRKESLHLLDELLKSTFLELFGDPVRNDKKWPLHKVSEFSDSRLGKMLDGNKYTGNSLKPYLRNTNVLWFRFSFDELVEMDFDAKERVEFSLRKGDILMCEGGDIGRCAIWKDELKECYFQKAIHRIRVNDSLVLPEYFVFMFWQYAENGGLKQYMRAATISHLTGEKLKKMNLPIPPLPLQTKFAQIVEKVEALKAHYQASLKELENLYGSLSQRAFKGELDLSGMDVSLMEDKSKEKEVSYETIRT